MGATLLRVSGNWSIVKLFESICMFVEAVDSSGSRKGRVPEGHAPSILSCKNQSRERCLPISPFLSFSNFWIRYWCRSILHVHVYPLTNGYKRQFVIVSVDLHSWNRTRSKYMYSGGSRISQKQAPTSKWGRQPIIWPNFPQNLHENERDWTGHQCCVQLFSRCNINLRSFNVKMSNWHWN